jgi:hypothetical protein
MEDIGLPAIALQLVRTGDLPSPAIARTCGGQSKGGACALCGAAIQPDAAEIELTWMAGERANSALLHPACHRYWLAATRNRLETPDE